MLARAAAMLKIGALTHLYRPEADGVYIGLK
jgi:hypothetical protein